MKKVEYKRCPRCELNFIKKNEKLCSVCQAELSNKDEYIDDDLELCPICKTNYIQPDEIMCSSCLKEHQTEDLPSTPLQEALHAFSANEHNDQEHPP